MLGHKIAKMGAVFIYCSALILFSQDTARAAEDVDIKCDVPIEKALEATKATNSPVICTGMGGGLIVTSLMGSSKSAMNTGGFDGIFNSFARDNPQGAEYAADYKLTRMFPRLWEVSFYNEAGDPAYVAGRRFVWSRDYDIRDNLQSPYGVSLGSTKMFVCRIADYNDPDSAPVYCATRYSAVVCPTWYENKPGLRHAPQSPIIRVSISGEKDVLTTMSHFEVVHRKIQDILVHILIISCEAS